MVVRVEACKGMQDGHAPSAWGGDTSSHRSTSVPPACSVHLWGQDHRSRGNHPGLEGVGVGPGRIPVACRSHTQAPRAPLAPLGGTGEGGDRLRNSTQERVHGKMGGTAAVRTAMGGVGKDDGP